MRNGAARNDLARIAFGAYGISFVTLYHLARVNVLAYNATSSNISYIRSI